MLQTADKRRVAVLPLFSLTSDEEEDAVFKTCISAGTEGTNGSPVSSSRTVSRKLNLDAFYNGPQLRQKGGSTDRASERSGRTTDVRGFLSTIYDKRERRVLEQHRRPKERETNTDALKNTASIVVSTLGDTLERGNSGVGVTKIPLSLRQTTLERLESHLEDRLRSEVHFWPKLREGVYEEEEVEGEERASSRNKCRSMEPSGASPIQMSLSPVVPGRTEPKTLNEPNIELSEPCDVFDKTSDMAIRQAEEKIKERQQQTGAKRRDRDLAECTFHPQISPNSEVLFRNSILDKGDVFDRLYPRELQELADKSRDAQRREELLLLESNEIEKLREHCGGMTAARVGGDSFKLFLHNVLGPIDDHASRYIQTDYRSPIARTLSVGALTDSAAAAERVGNKSSEERQYRILCFDEFLHRQNAHYKNRSRCVQNLEKALTPSFQPAISENSAQIAKDLLGRSSATTPDPTSMSALASAVKKHRSPYVDPCTFKPKITAVSRAMAPRGVEDMLKDSERFQNSKKRAQENALKEELRFPFRPSLNDARNSHVESLLSPKNYAFYEQCLRQQKLRRSAMKKELDAKKELNEVEHGTFRPMTTCKPEYVSRMASSFALVRQQYGEL